MVASPQLPASTVPDVDDYALLRRVAAHDHQAFEQLYWRYARRLQGFLRRLLPPQIAVEEVLNEVMLTVWQQAAQFEPRAPLTAWLFGIARHKALTALRTVKTPPESTPGAPDRTDSEDPEVHLLHQEQRQAVVQALAILPAVQREAVELTYYHGLSYQEIAALVGCPVNTVKTRMFKARQRLAEHLTHGQTAIETLVVT
jgi:RNA polymerase sigma-70 factor (ECF subfamily)